MLCFLTGLRPWVCALLFTCLAATALVAAPAITKSPADVRVKAGEPTQFTVSATGAGSLRYQWRYLDVPMPGATTAVLTLPETTRDDRGWYDVQVTDSSGSTMSGRATLVVEPTAYPALVARNSTPSYVSTDTISVITNAVSIVPTAGGGFLVCGDIAMVDETGQALARILPDGSNDGQFTPRITGGLVSSIVIQPGGKVVVCGSFTHIEDKPWGGLARLNADGSLDETFLSSAVDRATIYPAPDGQFYLARPNTPLARFQPDGTLDPTFSTEPMSLIGFQPLSVQPDGKVVLSASVQSSGPTVPVLRRLNLDGSVDSTFMPPRITRAATSILASKSGKIYVGGGLAIDNVSVPLTRLHSDGSVDRAFDYKSGTFAPTQVRLFLGEDNAGQLVVSGTFPGLSGVFRASTSGAVDPTFAPDVRSGVVQYGAILSDDRVILSHQLGSGEYPKLVLLSRNGALSDGLKVRLRSFGGIRGALQTQGAKTLIFGTFERVNGKAASAVARLNADGTLDASFSSPSFVKEARRATILADRRTVFYGSLKVQDSPQYGPSFLGMIGEDGTPFTVVREDLFVTELQAVGGDRFIVAHREQGTGVLSQLNANGTTLWTRSLGSGEISALAVQPDGKILAGGAFNSGSPKYLARLNGDGSLDASFNGKVNLPAAVSAIALSPSGQIYVLHQDAKGSPTRVVRLQPDGSPDADYAVVRDAAIRALHVQEDDRILIGEETSSFSANVVRLTRNGAVDATFSWAGVAPRSPSGTATLLMLGNGQLLYAPALSGYVYTTKASAAPAIVRQPSAATTEGDDSATLSVAVSADTPVTYQWQRNGVDVPGATRATLPLPFVDEHTAGEYTVRVTNDFGTTASATTRVDLPYDTRGRLANLSIRTAVGGQLGRVIMGYTLGGAGTSGTKPLLLRAVGPTLASFGVPGFLADPALELYNPQGVRIDENDDWSGTFDNTSVGAFALTGNPPKDAALFAPALNAGPLTFHVVARNGQSGIVLAEVYDSTPARQFRRSSLRLINGSAYSQVGTGNSALILGFAILGESPVKLLIRAVGPSLGAPPLLVPGVLADPKLELYCGDGVRLAENDNWGDSGGELALRAAFRNVSAFDFTGTNSKDAALIITLERGVYSAFVHGADNGTGTALVELYVVE